MEKAEHQKTFVLNVTNCTHHYIEPLGQIVRLCSANDPCQTLQKRFDSLPLSDRDLQIVQV